MQKARLDGSFLLMRNVFVDKWPHCLVCCSFPCFECVTEPSVKFISGSHTLGSVISSSDMVLESKIVIVRVAVDILFFSVLAVTQTINKNIS